METGCAGGVPVRQGFVAVLLRPDGSVVAAASPRWEVSLLHARDRATGRLVLGTHPRDVIGALSSPPPLDLAKLADLAALHDGPATTVWEGIERLPLGHVLETDPSGAPRVRRWFTPAAEQDRSIRLAEAPLLMREAVLGAVASSLPADGDVAATLSGGLDSGTVVAAAARRLAGTGRRIHAFTHAPLDGAVEVRSTWEADDAPYARALADQIPGIEVDIVRNTGLVPPLVAQEWLIERTWHPPFNPVNQSWVNEIYRRSEARGLSLLLTGAAGNATFSRGRAGILPELARSGAVGALAREVVRRRTAGAGWVRSGRHVLRESAPPGVRHAWHRLRGHTIVEHAFDVDDLPFRRDRLSAAARAELPLMANAHEPDRAEWVDFVHLDVSRLVMLAATSDRVWWSDPLSDPEVISLALRLPEEAWLVGGRSRGLARAAADGLVPDVVRLRETRGSQGADVHLAMVGQEGAYRDLLDRFRASPSVPEFIDLDRLAAAIGPQMSAPETAAHWQGIHGRAFAFGHYAVWYEDRVLARS